MGKIGKQRIIRQLLRSTSKLTNMTERFLFILFIIFKNSDLRQSLNERESRPVKDWKMLFDQWINSVCICLECAISRVEQYWKFDSVFKNAIYLMADGKCSDQENGRNINYGIDTAGLRVSMNMKFDGY